MLSPSDYNSAVPQFTNGDYASNPLNPLYIEEPDSTNYNRGVEPLQTLPAQWWNWFVKQFTNRFNKLNIYVKNIFNELAQLLTLVNMTPDGTESSPTIGQLKSAFQTEYPKYVALFMYPVGSLYWTGKAPDDGGDPNVLFGGTWIQIKGCFVWAKGDSDTLNATGGSKTVTLTTEQIPSHTHTFVGSPATSGNQSSNPAFSWSGSHKHSFQGWHESTSAGYAEYMVDSGSGFTPVFSLYGFRGNTYLYGNNNGPYRDGAGYSIAKSTISISGTTSGNHTHTVTANGSNENAGGGEAHDNMPPYIVKYCWERTA